MTGLKPCPWCGRSPTSVSDKGRDWYSCPEPKCPAGLAELPIEVWNRRARRFAQGEENAIWLAIFELERVGACVFEKGYKKDARNYLDAAEALKVMMAKEFEEAKGK